MYVVHLGGAARVPTSTTTPKVHKMPSDKLLWERVSGGALEQGAQEPLQVPRWNQEGQTFRAQKVNLPNMHCR